MQVSNRRVVFNLDDFVRGLDNYLEKVKEDNNEDEREEYLEDLIERFKNFLSRIDEKLLEAVKSYLSMHPIVLENQVVREYIESCYK